LEREKTYLVFVSAGLMLVNMDKPWFRKMFRRPPKQLTQSAQAQADGGNAEAQFSLGFKFANGHGVARDYVQAAYWYLRAADQNHPLAQFNLGVMFAAGQGMEPNDASAVMWIHRAAQQGDAGAQNNLGVRNQRAGFAGTAKDARESNVEAYKWFRLAAAQGYKGSHSAYECLSLALTRAEVADGDDRAARFIAVVSNPASAVS
jgi:hypothetical protein